LDARNVPGTRCIHVENHLKKNAAHKHVIIVINKCDLVPSWVTRKWVKILSGRPPTDDDSEDLSVNILNDALTL
jgi:nuclear GTP-binding protein